MICEAVQNLINYGIRHNLITNDDVFLVRNLMMDALCLTDWKDCVIEDTSDNIEELLNPIVEYAC